MSAGADLAEAYFYHLTRRRLEAALPGLLTRTLERGWRAVVRAGSGERVADLDRLLWSYADESFLPHGTAETGDAARQPIFLTAQAERPNGAEALFLVDQAAAAPEDLRGYARACVLFEARDAAAMRWARGLWKAVAEAGAPAVYFAETETGGFEKKRAANQPPS